MMKILNSSVPVIASVVKQSKIPIKISAIIGLPRRFAPRNDKICRVIIIFLSLTFISFSTFANEKLTVILDWFPNPNHAPLFVTKDKGFFQALGLDVEFIGPANPSDAPKLVAAGKADIGITYQPQFIEQVDQGLPLIRIGTLIDKPLDCLVVLNNGPIKKISDLKNKRVGYSSGSLNSIALKTMLEKNGLSLKDVQHINVQFDLTQALLTKKIDAATGMMRNLETVQMKLLGQPARIFLPEENGFPTYSELIFIINIKNLSNKSMLLFLQALKKGTKYLKAYPEESWMLFIKNHPELNNTLNHQVWLASLDYFADQPSRFDAQSWTNFINFMYQHKQIKIIRPLNNYTMDLNKE